MREKSDLEKKVVLVGGDFKYGASHVSAGFMDVQPDTLYLVIQGVLPQLR